MKCNGGTAKMMAQNGITVLESEAIKVAPKKQKRY